MELREYLDIIRRRWWILLLGPLVAGVAAYAVSRSMTPIYEATATVLVNQTPVGGVVQYNDILTSERLTNTYAELVERRPVLTETKRRLNLQVTEDQLGAQITVSAVRNTQLLRITAEDADANLAARIANTVAQAFIEDNAAQLSRPGTVTIAEQANVPSAPAKPNIMTNTILGAFLGLMLAGGATVLQEYLDDTIKEPEDIQAASGDSTLGVVGRFETGRPGRGALAALGDPDSAEAYRQLRTNVHFAELAHGLQTIVVISANPGEGKSTTVANLAVVLAQAGKRVLIVDTDLRKPSLHTTFGVPNSFGLTGLLLREPDHPEMGIIATGVPNLAILPSGPLPPNPSELLASPPMRQVMEALKSAADYVLFDSPPILAVTDASILASTTDGAILVAERGKTRSQALRNAHEALVRANARILGVVVNKAKRGGSGYYYGHYGHYRRGIKDVETQPPAAPPRVSEADAQ